VRPAARPPDPIARRRDGELSASRSRTMEFNIVLAGVGGQGILTTAQALSRAALRRGWHVKQAEVHGMSQRGGAVHSHLRLADHELASDLIPLGQADMILAAEPMEALRYVQYLAETGVIVSNTVPVVNIPNYGGVEEILDRIARHPRHVLIDANYLAGLAGATRAASIVMLGAASEYLDIACTAYEDAISGMFSPRGQRLVEINRRAFLLGRSAAQAYGDALLTGADSRTARRWVGGLSLAQLERGEGPDVAALHLALSECELSTPETDAIDQILRGAAEDGRRQLREHEVYDIVELAGAITPPRHEFIANPLNVTGDLLERFPGPRVVLKLVSADVVHKSDAGGVVFVRKDPDFVAREVDELLRKARHAGHEAAGVLIVEFVEHAAAGFGTELFVGIRGTREFGPVIAAGLGGIDTEYLAAKLRPGLAVAKALAIDTSPTEFFELFRRTAAYEIVSGKARGHERVVSDGELIRCFRAFIAIARRFCVNRGAEAPELQELEVNPFAFRRQTMIPLDGRGRLGRAPRRVQDRPQANIANLLEPRSIAVVGVSGKRQNFGRIILNNIRDCGFPLEHLYAIKDEDVIDAVRCVPSLRDAPEHLDLVIMAAGAQDVPGFIDEAIESGKVSSAIIIPGGLGEKAGTAGVQDQLRSRIADARSRRPEGPVFVGGNCMGLRSRPGRYDTFFIPPKKMDPRRSAAVQPVAIVSQSGAFIVSRLLNLEALDPAFVVSIGNQLDLTITDVVRALGRRGDVDVIGVYVEGFRDLDGAQFVGVVEDIVSAGKSIVFYKAGRTEAGRSATAGHTASVAGDYDICQAAVAQAGAIVVDTFKEFEQLLEIVLCSRARLVGRAAPAERSSPSPAGHRPRIGAISNAGFETVGMADAILGPRYQVEMARLSEETLRNLASLAAEHHLSGLVNVGNPLDLTPMAGDDAYEACIRLFLGDPSVDALIVSIVPATPLLLTTADEIDDPHCLAQRLGRIHAESPKPIVAVVDAGPLYEPYVRAIRRGGVPVLRSCDQAVRSLGRYLCHLSERHAMQAAAPPGCPPADSATPLAAAPY